MSASTEDILRAIRADDRAALHRASPIPDGVPGAILEALPTLGARARLVATSVLERCAGPERAKTLLRMTSDPDEQVSVIASQLLLATPSADLPPSEKIAYSIPVQARP